MRLRRTVVVLCAVGTVLGGTQAASAATPGETVTGTVRRAVVEVDLAPGATPTDADVEVTVVQTATGSVQVPSSDLDGVPTGATVAVRLGATVRPAARTPQARAESGRDVRGSARVATTLAAPAASTAVRRVLPVLVTVPGTAADGVTGAALGSAVAEASRFYDHETRGAVTYAALPPATASVPAATAASCDLAAVERAVRSTVSVPADTTLLLRTPKVAPCGFSGVAWIGGTTQRGLALWLNGTAAPAVVAHELGHTLGLGHSASSSACANGSDDGTAAACSTVEYGDFFDVMGSNLYAAGSRTPHLGEMNAAQRDRLGGFSTAELGAVDPTSTTTTTLAALGAATGRQAVRFTTGGATYYVELRGGAGRDAGLYPGGTCYGTTATGALGWGSVPTGVTVRRLDGTTAGSRSRLLEPRAAGPAFVLPAGAAFTTADGAVTVTPTAVTGSSATVRIAPRGTTPAPAPTPTAAAVPGAPVLSGARAGDRSAAVTIGAPTTGGAVKDYVLAVSSGGVVQGTSTVPATASTVTVDGLVNGRGYVLAVRARGTAGYGAEARTAVLTPRAGAAVPRAATVVRLR